MAAAQLGGGIGTANGVHHRRGSHDYETRESGSGLVADAQKLSVQLMPLPDLPERTIADYVGACQKHHVNVRISEVLCLSYLGTFGGFDAVCRRMPETTLDGKLVLRRQTCVDAAISLRKHREQEYPVLK